MNVTEELLRFAELVARTGLEPEFAQRPGTRTDAVAEFGPATGVSARAGGTAVCVESLSTADMVVAEWCVCMSTLLEARVGA